VTAKIATAAIAPCDEWAVPAQALRHRAYHRNATGPLRNGDKRSWGVSRCELRNRIVIAHPESWVAPLE
jgi:hypothetical protein